MDKIKKFLIINRRGIIFFISIIIFLAILEDIFEYGILKSDVLIYKYISSHLLNDFNTEFLKFLTNLGGVTVLILLTIIVVMFIKNKKVAITIPINLIIVTILNVVLKNVVQRERPNELRLVDESSYSFPSGHSMISTAFYGYFIYLIYKYVENKCVKGILIALLSGLIILIAFSRIYLGVHYTSDVLSGLLISVAYLMLFTGVTKIFIK